MFEMLEERNKEGKRLRNGEITKEEYDKWRYNYPNVK
jgi:hypothetical protein